ncbi:MAG: hypothetical protein MZV70_06960 [Desulfobacterales bacterium]|nr:hypothetical protein [Desulfobacterales bacterium]
MVQKAVMAAVSIGRRQPDQASERDHFGMIQLVAAPVRRALPPAARAPHGPGIPGRSPRGILPARALRGFFQGLAHEAVFIHACATEGGWRKTD